MGVGLCLISVFSFGPCAFYIHQKKKKLENMITGIRSRAYAVKPYIYHAMILLVLEVVIDMVDLTMVAGG